MSGDGRAALGISGQAGDVTTGGIAGNDYITNNLADLPIGLQRVLADQHEAAQLTTKSIESMQARLERLIGRVQDNFDLYRATEASERRARQAEAAQERAETIRQLEALVIKVESIATTAEMNQRQIVRLYGLTWRAIVALAVVGLILAALIADRLLGGALAALAVALIWLGVR